MLPYSAVKSKHKAWVFSVCLDYLHFAQQFNRYYKNLKIE